MIEPFWIRLACARQRFHKPKGAHAKNTFLARKPIDPGMRRITMYEAVGDI
jgi:hypothetical protein